MEKEQLKKKQVDSSKEDTEITPLYLEVLEGRKQPLYPDNETALVAYREKLSALAKRHEKSVEDYLNEARAANPRSRDHMDALQYMRGIGFFLSKQR